MYEGSIKSIVEGRGFGFIRCHNLDKDVFFHSTELSPGVEFDPSIVEMQVSFSVKETDKGPRAINVQKTR